VARQGIGREDGAAGCGVVNKAVGGRQCDALAAHGATLLSKLGETTVGVKVPEADAERVSTSACDLCVQPEQEGYVVASDFGMWC
jgi:hypothetical protein